SLQSVVKALYGLHQDLRAWYKTLTNYHLENGFQKSKIDQTLFIKREQANERQVLNEFNGGTHILFGSTIKQKLDGIFISQDKYVAEILRKFSLTDRKSASTPIDTEKPLLKDPDAYSDSDYAGASLDRKSTTGRYQFLGCRLISWQCKKQTVFATSFTEAEFGIVLLGKEEELKVDGLKFALSNRILLWKSLKIRVLRWTVLKNSSLVSLTVLIEIISLKMILIVILLSRLHLHLLKQKKLMQTQEDHSNPIQALNIDLVVIQNTCSEKEDTDSETVSSKSVKESSLDYATKDVHAIKYNMSKAKERRMTYFRSLHSHLQVLSKEDLKGTHIEHGFKQTFMSLFGQDVDTFTSTMLINVYQLQKQLDKDEFQEDGTMAAFWVDNNILSNLKSLMKEKVFAIAALKNDLRKLKGNIVDTKFAKTSVMGKPVLQSLRKQSVVRQPNAFKSERPQMSKPRFASQVDVSNNLSRPVTQHYLPKRRECVFAKPNHMIASNKSRKSSKNMPRFSSNDMVHNPYIDEARKNPQERDRNSKPSVMSSARFQSTADGSKPNL
nr:hypothetical protein [Tanacetum cinerariifolium]